MTHLTTFRRLLGVVLLTMLGTLASAAEPAKKSFDIPSGDAAATLKQFVEQSGEQVVYLVNTVRGTGTKPVKGKFSAREALDRMLGDTSLIIVQDEKTGALTVNRTAGPNAPRAAQTESDRPDQSKVEDGKLVLEKVEVTGSRIRGLLGEADFSPLVTFTRADIEHTGLTSMGELSRLIPQAYSTGSFDGMGMGGQSTGLGTTGDGSLGQATTTGRATINLRGLGTANTLVLIDGRRMPKTGVIRGADANDLSGIPVSMVERIEVLTDGASAIYGSDAVGGVINIITRKNYSGTELSLTYENTFDSDTAARTATLTHAVSAGKLSLSISAMWQDRHAFAAVDRRFTATDDWFTLGEPVTSAFSRIGLANGFSTTAGLVFAASGNLPGVGTPYATIPDGGTPANLTLASYIPTTSLTATLGDRAKYANIIDPQEKRNGSFNATYRLTPNHELFAYGRYSDSITSIGGLPVNFLRSLSVPANYPGNPFGAAVSVSKVFWELGPISGAKKAKTSDGSVGVGLRGSLPRDWRYEAGFDAARSILQDKDALGPNLNTAAYNAAIAAQSLVIFYDSRAVQPNDLALIRSLLTDNSRYDKETTASLNASLDGPVWTLPAGQVRLAFGGEHRRETAMTRLGTPVNTAVNLDLVGDFKRVVDSGYAEVRVPVVSPRQKIPLVNRLDLSSAIRYDTTSDVKGAYSPSFGAQWRPVSWALLRATRNESFHAPALNALYRPVFPTTVNVSANSLTYDPFRGNAAVIGSFPSVQGGNIGLKPETSVSRNLGLVLQAPPPLKWLKGVSAAVDYLDIDYTNLIAQPGTQSIINYFPDRVTRGPALATDPAGYLGPITGLDARAVNFAKQKIRTIDYQLSYQRSTPYGEVTLRGAATTYRKFLTQSTPLAAPVDTLFRFPSRFNWQSYWSKGPYGVGVSGAYYQRQWFNATHTATANFPTGIVYNSTIEWNLQVAYDFGYGMRKPDPAAPASRLSRERLRDGLKVSLTVNNILNREPAHIGIGQAGFAFTDPRMARYALALRKRF